MILRALAVLALLLCAEGGDPTWQPTGQPSRQPSSRPSTQPSSQPTGQPSRQPTGQPSMQPTTQPTGQPTTQPTSKPSLQPSRQPTGQPSRQPTGQPSAQPSAQPTGQPTMQPSLQPTSRPTMQPTQQPTSRPSNQPSGQPSRQPFGRPTGQPSRQPTQEPTNPSGQPTRQPSGQPSRQPTMRPSRQPTNRPSGQPSSAPSAGKSLIVTQVAQQFTGMSTQTYCSSFGCGAACSNAQEAFSDTIRRTVLFVLKLSSVRHVLWVDGPKCRRRLLLSETEGAGQYSNPNLRRLDSSSDSITVTFEVQTADPAVNPSTITATITSAVNSGYYTSLLRTFAVANKLNSLESFSAGMVLSAVATKTSSPVIIPTFSPTEQTALMWLKKWYIPWSVACAVLGTCIIVTAVALIRRRQHMMQEEMLDLENRKKAADELLARRFAPGVTAANAPHILKMRDNFKRAYGRDPSSKSPYDETKSSADLETFMASPHDDSSLGHGRAGSPSSPTGGSGASAAWLKHASSASSSGSKGRYPAMNKTPQKHSLTRAATSTVPTPRVKTVLTLGGSPGPGEADQSPSRTPGDRPDVTNLTGDALRKLVVSERSLNRDYRYTLMLPERETTARMNDLLQSPAKPTAKEASVLQRYVSDLMAENDKMLKQLEKMRLTGTYTGTSASGVGAGSRVMLTGGSGGGGYAPTGSVNKDALKRSQTSPRGREGDSPSPGGAGGSGAYSPRARNSS